MRKILIPIAVSFLFSQCIKSTVDDLAGDGTIRGVAIVYDTLNGTTSLATLKNAKVYLKYTDSTNGFLYSSVTDASGYYKFTGIDDSKKYTVYSGSDTGQVKFAGELSYAVNNYKDALPDTLKLLPIFNNQNGIHLLVRDNQGGAIPGATAWVFNSPVLFAADTSAGRAFDIVSNATGTGNRYNLPAGTYYLRIKTKIGNLDMAGEERVILGTSGLKNVVLTISTNPLPRNGIEAQISDLSNTPVYNAKIYCYRNFTDYSRDTSTFANSLFSMISTPSGLASAYLIEPGTYYLRAIKTINVRDTLKDKGTVVVNPGVISTINMIVK